MTAEIMADVRRQLAPEPNAADAVAVICADCGGTFWRWRRGKQTRCVTCSELRTIDGAESMRQKRGPMYEKAVRRQFAYWAGEMERLGLDPAGD